MCVTQNASHDWVALMVPDCFNGRMDVALLALKRWKIVKYLTVDMVEINTGYACLSNGKGCQ